MRRHRNHIYLTIAALLSVPLLAFSQLRLMRPQYFKQQLPAGNYSGLASLGGNRYAVVSDKEAEDGFYVFYLRIDTLKGRIVEARNEGYFSSQRPNRDMEGIVFCPATRTVFISGEADNEVHEYALDGKPTGRKLLMPAEFRKANRNLGLESLAYDAQSHLFYTTTERPLPGDSLLRIQTFGDNLQPLRQFLYRPDAPISRKFFHGVAELCATEDGRLLVLERQIRVPRLKIGAKTVVRIYETRPSESLFLAPSGPVLEKHLLCEFTTRIHLASRSFANYEGLCATPYPNWYLIVADSQGQHKGLLRDWFRLFRLAP